MATRFELLLRGEDPVRLRAAGEQALLEIERTEAQLSFYRPSSDIRRINTEAALRPVKVEPGLFQLLERCSAFAVLTDGAFDITVGPLMRAWRFVGESGAMPDRATLEDALLVSGIPNLKLDEERHLVRFKRGGVEIDLGAYGKGVAIERARHSLCESGIGHALLHGGTSSIWAIGSPADSAAWRIALAEPFSDNPVIELNDSALSVSGAHGKSFTVDGTEYGHVIDPRTGWPVSGTKAAAIIGPSAADAEALSTALMVLGAEWLPTMAERFPEYQAHIAT